MDKKQSNSAARDGKVVEEVEVRGHIIDSLILPKILDVITAGGGAFRIKNITIGQGRNDGSYALLEVRADQPAVLAEILGQIADHGAVSTHLRCSFAGSGHRRRISRGFYSTTNQRTEIRLDGQWIGVADQEMDCGIVVDRDAPSGRQRQGALHSDDRCAPRNADRRRPCRRARVSGRAEDGAAGVRVHEQRRLDREAQGSGDPANCPGDVSHEAERREDAVGRRAGDRAHRQRRARLRTDPRRLRPSTVRRQRPGDARHRAGAVRHQPGRAPGSRRSGRGRARAPPAGDQPHPPRRRHPPGGRKRRAEAGSCTNA